MDITSIIIDDEMHAIAELAEVIAQVPGISLVGQFESAVLALDFLKSRKHVDVIFCDISMPGMDGIQAAKLLRTYGDFLIYVSAYRDYALDAFGVHASGYLLKPVSLQSLIDKVVEIINQKDKRQSPPHENVVFVKGDSKHLFFKIHVQDMIYIKAMLNYVCIYTEMAKYTTYMTLKAMQEQLEKYSQFRRISKSIMVNIDHIQEVDGQTLRLSNGDTVTVGESYKSAFHAFIRKHTLNLSD